MQLLVVCIKRSIACSDGETSRGSKWLSRGDEYTPPLPKCNSGDTQDISITLCLSLIHPFIIFTEWKSDAYNSCLPKQSLTQDNKPSNPLLSMYWPYDHTSDLVEYGPFIRTSGADHLIGKQVFTGLRSELNIDREKSVTFTMSFSPITQLRAACKITQGVLSPVHYNYGK